MSPSHAAPILAAAPLLVDVQLAWPQVAGAVVALLASLLLVVRGRSDLRDGPRSRGWFLLFGAFCGLAFVGLMGWTATLSNARGAAFSLRETFVRAGTIVTGVFLVLTTLTTALPFLLDRLEGRGFVTFVAARHVRSQKSGFLTVISVLSICGVALSSCALATVISVMGGFSQDLKHKILGHNAHLVVDVENGSAFEGHDDVVERVRGVPGVVGATAIVRGEVMLSSASNLAGVVVTGIDPPSFATVSDLGTNLEVGKMLYLEEPERLVRLPADEVVGLGAGGEKYLKGSDLLDLPDDLDPEVRAVVKNKADRPGIVVGRELAKTLHLYVGDEVTLLSPLGDLGPMGLMPRTKRFRVAGIFYSAMYEYDATYVYVMRDVAQDFFGAPGRASAIEVKVADADAVEGVLAPLEVAKGRPDLRVRDWRAINKSLFSALKLERFATFVILSIATLVASFCIICTLLLMVTEKGKEIAILKALGASDGGVLRVFLIEGIVIGSIGTAFGVVTGLSICFGLLWFGLRLDPDVYYIDRLPITVNGLDFGLVAASAIVICALATVYPAWTASRLRPVDGLRYE